MRSLIAFFIIVISLSAGAKASKTATPDADIPDIKDIPRLAAGLAPGTIAWATPDQLHPTQPQTGHREVARKVEDFEALLKKNVQKFSKKLFKDAYTDSVSPVYIAQTPESDSRYGTEAVLGYITDRTHGSDAQSQMILKTYGEKALSEPIYDSSGRPLNFILVKVMGDKSNLSPSAFADFMVRTKNCYLKLWSRGSKGKTVISDISFDQLPEKVIDTSDNPYRGLIGALQHEDELGRSTTDFSQFVDSQALVDNNVVTWDEISLQAGKKVYKKAEEKAATFFKSPKAKGLPGTEPDDNGTDNSAPQCSVLF